MSFGGPSISDYYREAKQQIESYLWQGIPDESRILLDKERLASQLMEQYAFSRIEVTSGPQKEVLKTREEGDDGWGHTGMATVFYIRLKLQVKEDRKIKEILARSGNTLSSNPPNIRYEKGCLITDMRAGNWDEDQTEKAVAAMVENIQKEIQWRNDAIQQENVALELRIKELIERRGTQIEKENEQLRRLLGKQG
jgi:hypothetical protein